MKQYELKAVVFDLETPEEDVPLTDEGILTLIKDSLIYNQIGFISIEIREIKNATL